MLDQYKSIVSEAIVPFLKLIIKSTMTRDTLVDILFKDKTTQKPKNSKTRKMIKHNIVRTQIDPTIAICNTINLDLC